MTIPSITATYLGLLGLLYAFLGLRVANFAAVTRSHSGTPAISIFEVRPERMRTSPSMCPSSSS